MNIKNLFKKDLFFYWSVGLTIFEGILSGCNFKILYEAFKSLSENNFNLSRIIELTGFLAFIFILRIVVYGAGFTLGQIGGSKVSRRIRLLLGNKLGKIPLSGFSKKLSGSYINIVTENVNAYEDILTHKIGNIIKYTSLCIAVIVFLLVIYPKAGIISGIAFLLLIPVMKYSFSAVSKFGPEKQVIMTENTSRMTEYITGIQTLRAYGMGGVHNKRLVKTMKDYSDISYYYEKKIIPLGVFYSILSWMSLPLTIYCAGQSWIKGTLETPSFIMVSMIPVFTAKIFGMLFVDLTSFKHLSVAKKKILSLANRDEEPEIESNFNLETFDVEFKNVNFSYTENEPVLRGMDIVFPAGKISAIVGDSGAGKSTVLNLISKYYEPDKGCVKISGINTKNIGSELILEQISMVDQNTFLFDDTIINNIRYARPDADDEEIINVCKLACCHEFIMKMEKGYKTIIGENGGRLSGGERQRLSVARAMIRKSPIVLLDEATASLDIENELAVKKAIYNLLSLNRTIIMIAHNLHVIKNADLIAVLGKGRILESGNHDELYAKKGKYYSMWQAEQALSVWNN